MWTCLTCSKEETVGLRDILLILVRRTLKLEQISSASSFLTFPKEPNVVVLHFFRPFFSYHSPAPTRKAHFFLELHILHLQTCPNWKEIPMLNSMVSLRIYAPIMAPTHHKMSESPRMVMMEPQPRNLLIHSMVCVNQPFTCVHYFTYLLCPCSSSICWQCKPSGKSTRSTQIWASQFLTGELATAAKLR